MKERTYTIACGKDAASTPDSKLLTQFEHFLERKVEQFRKSGKQPLNTKFITIRIEDERV